MLDEKDLQAIAQLMDGRIQDLETRLDAKLETELETKLETKLAAYTQLMDSRIQDLETRLETKLETKLNAKLEAATQDITSQLMAYIEAAVTPKFDLLADGFKLHNETKASVEQVEAPEEELAFVKQLTEANTRDIAALKKAL